MQISSHSHACFLALDWSDGHKMDIHNYIMNFLLDDFSLSPSLDIYLESNLDGTISIYKIGWLCQSMATLLCERFRVSQNFLLKLIWKVSRVNIKFEWISWGQNSLLPCQEVYQMNTKPSFFFSTAKEYIIWLVLRLSNYYKLPLFFKKII